MKRVERKDFSLDSRISLEPQNPPIGAMTFEKKKDNGPEWKKSLDRLENVIFEIDIRDALVETLITIRKMRKVYTYNYQG
jgi:hypothetical protein